MHRLAVGEHEIKVRIGNLRIKGKVLVQAARIFWMFPFNRDLQAEIKSMEGHHYHGYDTENPRKIWSVKNSDRNQFQIAYLMELNPYARYDQPIPDLPMAPRFHQIKKIMVAPLAHQPRMAAHLFYRKGAILAAEMGTTKTLCAITAAEKVDTEVRCLTPDNFWYVAPKAALKAVEREFMIWGCKILPTFMTYEKMTSVMKSWNPGQTAPFVVIFDEASKIKTKDSQRSQAAKALADGVRKDHQHMRPDGHQAAKESLSDVVRDQDGYVWELSGSPAPKAPTDWYWLAEVACPGFLKEGDPFKFKNRLAVIVQKENAITGGVYPQLLSWRDDARKCDVCGEFASADVHDADLALIGGLEHHAWKQSVNEVAFLYKRLQGLVLVVFKKDCLDLPEKHYRTIEVKPTQSTLRAAKLLTTGAKTVISGLTRLRELSDGFQYQEIPKGERECPRCKGSKESLDQEEVEGTCPSCGIPGSEYLGRSEQCLAAGLHLPTYISHVIPCPECGAKGVVQDFVRITAEVPCPKDQVLKDILDEHEDVGRIVIYGGFTGSIDRCLRICHQSGWATIRVDQGAWRSTNYDGNPIDETDHLSMFQDRIDKYPKVAFVAHAGSAGMGLTLTASPTIVYFSNDFNAENRIQSEDRIHRPGMDVNRGATIIDILHLPTDAKVLENLRRKRELQSMTLGEFDEVLRTAGTEREV